MVVKVERGATAIAAPIRGGNRSFVVASVVAVVAVLIAGFAVMTSGHTRPVILPDARPIYTQDERTVLDLVDRGVLPVSVLDLEPFRTKRLVAEGIIPRATLDERAASGDSATTDPLYCPDELAVLRAVEAGTRSPKVLQSEPFRTKRLIAEGMIPRAAAPPC